MKLQSFANEPLLELRRREVRDALSNALAELDAELPLDAPMLIGPRAREGEELVSCDPGRPARVVALACEAGVDDASEALAVAVGAAAGWAHAGAAVRARALLGAAAWMRERRLKLAALCVRECAKPWAEADADVAEAIDYLEYYARGALALERGGEVLDLPGERNSLRYFPRGVCAVIAPWNFPIAIPMGMSSAALATGNAVVLKPAEQSPGCGAMVVQALRAGGVPPEVIGLLPGGGEAGAALVSDPRVQTIAFTGSAEVGLGILRAAAEVQEGQRDIKRVVAELGGKNCVIVDSDADLDEAVPAVVRSAFAYAGQKCSAAARVMVHEAIAELFLERLAGAVQALQVGQAETFGVDLGPVIERSARDRIERYLDQGAAEGELIAQQSNGLPEEGWFCPPSIVTGLAPESPLLREEIFGPLLAVERVSGVEDALERVRSLPYALTGGLFCRNPRTVSHVVERSPVGNLYVNRHITGAMVGRQPFGGNRLSGSGAKAGGPDYLREFVESRLVSENVLRHGLVV